MGDLSRLINSDEIQSKVNAPKEGQKAAVLKSNPPKSAAAMEVLNPFAVHQRKANAAAQAKAEKAKKSIKKVTKEMRERKKAYYKSMVEAPLTNKRWPRVLYA